MLRRRILIGGTILMALSFLTGCFGKSYTIGKNPKLDEITSITAGGGGMEYSSSWSYSASRSSRNGDCTLTRVAWNEEKNEMENQTVLISGDDYETILASVEGLKYIKYNPPKNVMDGYSQSARIFWLKSPSGSYRIDFGDKGMGVLTKAFAEVWEKNIHKADEPFTSSGVTLFSFSYGPTDIANGNRLYTAEVDKKTGEVTISYKRSGESTEEMRVADISFINSLDKILAEDGAYEWDGFSGHDMQVMDGSAFYLSVYTSSGKKIIASGHMQYPEGYGQFREDIEELFGSVFDPQ